MGEEKFVIRGRVKICNKIEKKKKKEKTLYRLEQQEEKGVFFYVWIVWIIEIRVGRDYDGY